MVTLVFDFFIVGPTPGDRGAAAAAVTELLRAAGVAEGAGKSITEHETIGDAYCAASEAASADGRILAFGSFLTVAETLRAIRAMPAQR